VGRKTPNQQNPPVLNWRGRLLQVDLCNGHKMVVVFLLASLRKKKENLGLIFGKEDKILIW